MNIFNLSRRKKRREKNIFDDEAEGRKQFNIVIDEDIIIDIQEMAKSFRVNQSVLTEHLLQVALFYTNIAIKDEEKENALEQHLINTHLLGKNVGDEEIVIRSTVDTNNNWMLLARSQEVIASAKRSINTMKMAARTHNLSLFQKAQKDLRREVLMFAGWIIEGRFEND